MNRETLQSIVNTNKDWFSTFKNNRYELFESLPIPAWKRLKLVDFELPNYTPYTKPYLEVNTEALDGALLVKEMLEGLQEHAELETYVSNPKKFGVNDKYVTLGEVFHNAGIFVTAPKGKEIIEPVINRYELDEQNPLVIDYNIIVAEEKSKINIIFDYSSIEGVAGFHNGVTKVYAKDFAEVTIIKFQRLNEETTHFDSNVAYLGREAKVNWITIEVGGKIVATSYVNHLDEDLSESNVDSLYIGDGHRRLDLGFTMNHYGMRTNSNIESRGVLKDHSTKVFRGNLDFKKGARKSTGNEEEFVILLDPTVKSDAIPALLCDEDDVSGQHAASAGQIDAAKLFYLMSRGLSEKEAKKLIVEASFRPILDKIPYEEYRNMVEEVVNRRMTHA